MSIKAHIALALGILLLVTVTHLVPPIDTASPNDPRPVTAPIISGECDG